MNLKVSVKLFQEVKNMSISDFQIIQFQEEDEKLFVLHLRKVTEINQAITRQ